MSDSEHYTLSARGLISSSRLTVTEESLLIESGLNFRARQRREFPLNAIDYIEIPGLSRWGTITILELYSMILVLTLISLVSVANCLLIEHVPVLVDRLITMQLFCIATVLAAYISCLNTQRVYIMVTGERVMLTMRLKGNRAQRVERLQALITEVNYRRDILKLEWIRQQINLNEVPYVSDSH